MMADLERHWPEGLAAYKRTPEFTEVTVPAGLLRSHSTKAGVWAKIHVLSGRLRFTDLVQGGWQDLEVGIHSLVYPQAEHEVAPLGEVRFFVEFYAAPGVSSPAYLG